MKNEIMCVWINFIFKAISIRKENVIILKKMFPKFEKVYSIIVSRNVSSSHLPCHTPSRDGEAHPAWTDVCDELKDKRRKSFLKYLFSSNYSTGSYEKLLHVKLMCTVAVMTQG